MALLTCFLIQLEDTDSFEAWEKLVRAAEGQEGGINRNSSPQAITATRTVYDRFLAKFPLLFGYWKKYADLEFSIAGTEAAEMVSIFLFIFFEKSHMLTHTIFFRLGVRARSC